MSDPSTLPTGDQPNPRDLFHQLIAETRPSPVLEIGTLRPEPENPLHRMAWFPHVQRRNYVMADKVAGLDVDQVCDVHDLPDLWRQRFQACVATSLFQHLERPWVAARQLHKVMSPGGVCYVATHQCFPLHGSPGDFFRFSAAALELIFKDAGFAVLAVGYEDRCQIVPPETALPGYLVQQWNVNHASYINVHLVAVKPPL